MLSKPIRSRRTFLQQGIGRTLLVGTGVATPLWHPIISHAANQSAADRVLVMVELAGGNDGLNSVIPYRDDHYRSARPTLGVPEHQVLSIDDEQGFHPELRGFADLLEQDSLAVIQGVGYPNPNRSHFESMDIWHTCRRKHEARFDGWIGRYLERLTVEHGDPTAIHIGPEDQPSALMSRDVRVPSIASMEAFRLEQGNNENFVDSVRAVLSMSGTKGNDLLDFVQSSTQAAVDTSQRLEATRANYQPHVTYPQSRLANKLKTVATLIASSFKTRVYYVRIDGFDTHANQLAAHASLLGEVGDAVGAFVNDLSKSGHAEQVLTVCFSEFGRRVQENASEGTDHGAAGPMFIAGPSVRAGLIGQHPSLSQLQQGDLIYHTDFRRVYAGILESWLQVNPTPILGKSFPPIPLLTV